MSHQSIKIFDQYANEYDQWFDKHPDIFQSELKALKKVVPQKLMNSLEIGVGSGRFANALGIQYGLDPAKALLEIAKSRGIIISEGVAENLPFTDDQFDTVFFITTLCFVNEPRKAIKEAKRVLKSSGKLIIAMIDRDSVLGQSYATNKKQNLYYKYAHFFSVPEIINLLKNVGFSQFEFYQTMFLSSRSNEIKLAVKPGFGEGGFVVIKALQNI
jgi:ubiquinone/menaquinone biosynthesis C-methylase UbiE